MRRSTCCASCASELGACADRAGDTLVLSATADAIAVAADGSSSEGIRAASLSRSSCASATEEYGTSGDVQDPGDVAPCAADERRDEPREESPSFECAVYVTGNAWDARPGDPSWSPRRSSGGVAEVDCVLWLEKKRIPGGVLPAEVRESSASMDESSVPLADGDCWGECGAAPRLREKSVGRKRIVPWSAILGADACSRSVPMMWCTVPSWSRRGTACMVQLKGLPFLR
mmetsp:Transcript_29033/g.85115  ORF Transcript_29033/g.85115 Transcript_29033/m.85115 type:complete len:230 (+) Transcript_29033:546-1235(+)